MRDRILEEVKPEKVMDYYGIEGKRGRYLCPFHNDTKPSMTIKGDLIRCWSCMGKSVNVIDFVIQKDNVGFRDALERLANMAGLTIGEDSFRRSAKIDYSKLIRKNEEQIKELETMLEGGGELVNEKAILYDLTALQSKKQMLMRALEGSGAIWD